MKKSKVGDIFKISTNRGEKYGIYTHKNKLLGSLIHMFEGFYSLPPDRTFFDEKGVVQFSVFFPLDRAVKDSVIDIVKNYGIPKRFENFPLFKTGIPDAKGKVNYWWIWDGEVDLPVGALTQEQREYPKREIWNDTLLIERINSDWTPKQHPNY